MNGETATPNDSAIDAALKAAERAPGWNGRNPAIRRFALGSCILIVVPARRWTYRHTERLAQMWRKQKAEA